jgi:hypothetical protein
MSLNKYPKSIKKAVRYIRQDAPKELLPEIKRIIDKVIEQRYINLK